MEITTREALRASIIEQLLAQFPTSQRVSGGVAFRSDVMDEATGLFFPVELKVTVRNTAPTSRSEAYDLDKAVAEFAAKPGRRVADPEKKAQREAVKAAAAAKHQASIGILNDWIKNNELSGMSAAEIHEAIPALAEYGITVMNVGVLLKELVADGTLTVGLDDKRKKRYSKAQ